MIGVFKGLSFTLFGVFFALGMVFYQYRLWKILRDHFSSQELMGMIWFSCFLALLGGRLVFILTNWGQMGLDFLGWFLFWRYAGFSWLGFYFFWVASLWLYSKIKNWSYWMVLEEAIGPFLVWLALSWMGQFFSSSFSLFSNLSLVLAFGFLYFFTGWMSKRYRSWAWYPSGKKGFLFLANNLLFFVVFLLLDFVREGRLYSVDILYSGWIIFVLVNFVVLSDYKLNILDRKRNKNGQKN
jgi:hypothetical protein